MASPSRCIRDINPAPRRPTLLTVLPQQLRSQLSAAVQDQFHAIHAESLEAACKMSQTTPPDALVVSPVVAAREPQAAAEHLIANCRGAVAVATVNEHGPSACSGSLRLGVSGVRNIVDLTTRSGWTDLRGLLAPASIRTANTVLREIDRAVGEMRVETRQFFSTLVQAAPRLTTVKQLTGAMQVQTTSLVSRFVRAGLPSPKRYLAGVRLVYVAQLLEDPKATVASTAYRLGYASPQSLGRHLRLELGITPSEFRSRNTFESTLGRFIEGSITPFVPTLKGFSIEASILGRRSR